MEIRHITTTVRGRFLYEPKNPARLLVGFHGYAQTAEINMADLRTIPGVEQWSLAAIQALHPFYTRGETTGASWMTRQDRELLIADNLDYIRRALGTLPRPETLVFLGFSQGVAMAYRAAADFDGRCHGVIALGGDVPPDVRREGVRLPPVLVGHGTDDDWYPTQKFEKDLKYLRDATDVTECAFEGGHEWKGEFRSAAGAFLKRLLL